MIKLCNRKSSECVAMSEFLKEQQSSLLLLCEGSMDKVLTQLNKEKPISSNRQFYLNHIICQIHKEVTLQNLRQVVIDNKYPHIRHVFIKDFKLNCEDSECEFVNSVLQSISKELGIEITLATTNQIHFRSVNNNRTTPTKEKELLSIEG